jgi:hypothetical protein
VLLAPDQRFQQQKELFGEHGAAPLAMACFISSLHLSGLNRLHSITSARAPADAALALSAIGSAGRGLSPKPGPLRGGAQPGAEVSYSRAPDHGDVTTGALVPPEFRGAPTHRVVDLVQQVEPGIKQRMAPLKRPHRRFFGMTSPGLHGIRH